MKTSNTNQENRQLERYRWEAKQFLDTFPQMLFIIGAKDMVLWEDGELYMKIGSRKYNYLGVKLENDLYTLRLSKMHGGKKIREEIRTGIYVDEVQETIRDITGLATRMPRFARG